MPLDSCFQRHRLHLCTNNFEIFVLGFYNGKELQAYVSLILLRLPAHPNKFLTSTEWAHVCRQNSLMCK